MEILGLTAGWMFDQIGTVTMNEPDAVDDLIADLPEWVTLEEIADTMRVKPQTVLK